MKLPLLLAALTLIFSAQAQNEPASAPIQGKPIDILPLTDTSFAYLILNDNESLRLSVMDRKGRNIGNDIPLDKNAIGLAKYDGGCVVFYEKVSIRDIRERRAMGGDLRELHGRLIDLNTGKVGEDKTIISLRNRYSTKFLIQRDAGGNFQGILTRYTKQGIKGVDAEEGDLYLIEPIFDFYETTDASYTTLQGDDLLPNTNKLSTALIGGFALGNGAVSKDGSFYILSASPNTLTLEKFHPSGELDTKLSTPFTARTFLGLKYIIRLDTLSNNAVTVALNYENAHHDNIAAAYRFDFSNGLIYTHEDVLNKEYRKTLEDAVNAHGSSFKSIESLGPDDVLTTQDWVIVTKDIEETLVYYRASSPPSYSYNGAVISVFDKKMNLIRTIPFEKVWATYNLNRPGFSAHLVGTELYTLGMNNEKERGVYLHRINLQTGTVDKMEAIRTGDDFYTETQLIYWGKGGYLVNYVTEKGMFKSKFTTTYQSFKYAQ
jgi:hypothetical protein